MVIPPRPANEAQRLEALHAIQILDTPSEERFDRITRLAQQLCEVPISTVTLIDDCRQWFKSRVGVTNSETPRDVSFCAHAVLKDEMMIVPDTLQDERFRDNPLVTGAPHIRFYAGQPLHSAKGYLLGTLCVIDRQPRQLDARQQEALRDLALMAENELNNITLHEALEHLTQSRRLLAEREAMISTFFEHSPLVMGILELEPEGKIRNILVNRAMEVFLGRPKNEIQAKPLHELGVAPEAIELWCDKCKEAERTGNLTRFEYERTNGDGGRKWLRATCGVLSAGDKRFAFTIEDVTERKEAEEELQRSEALFRQLSTLAPVGIFMNDPQGRCIYVNERWCSYTGFTAEQAMGEGWAKAVHPEDRERVVEEWGNAVKFQKEFELKFRFMRANGFVVWASVHAMAVTDKRGEVTGYIGAVNNITGLKQAEERLVDITSLQKAILDSANSSIISCSPDGIIRSFNSTAERWLGYDSIEVIGKETPAIIHDEEEVKARAEVLTKELGREVEPGFETFVAKARAGQADENEWSYIRRDGSRFPVMLSVTALYGRDGEITGFLGIGRDITLQRQAAEELQRAKETAEQANIAKSQFLANMSHEIRTPLNGIIGVNDLLLETGLGPEQLHFADTIRSSAESLLTIVNDILDLSKIEAGRLTFERIDFNLPSVMENVIELLANRASAKGLVLETDIATGVPTGLHGDPGRLRQVLLNLVGNAIKFTEGGKVRVEVKLVENDGLLATLKFLVIDDGIGISRESRDKIFEAFAQADNSTTRKFGGTGLGLTISRQLVELMGGEIGVESKEGKGSTFWFTALFTVLPMGRRVADAPRTGRRIGMKARTEASSRKQTTGGKKYRVLLAEDSAVNQMVALHQLQKLDCEVTAVGNGREVLEALSKDRYDVVLMDCQMPVMDGYEATAEIRRREGNERHTKIIAITANALAGEREKCLGCGMDEYLSKPFRGAELRSMMEAVIEGKAVTKPAGKAAGGSSAPIGREEIEQLQRESAASGTDLFRKMVALFKGTASTLLQDLENACDRKDFPAIERAAHKLKGSCSNFGAEPMQTLCNKIIENGRAGSLPELRKHLEKLHEEYLRVESALAAEIRARRTL